MKATEFTFRFRVPLSLLLYLLGFLAPWQRLIHSGNTTLWLAASTRLEHTGWLGLAAATLTVTNVAFGCLVIGAILRVWGTAYLGPSIVLGSTLQSTQMVATGPYRYLRHPLYLGSWLLGLGSSILMPLSGALVFLITFSLLFLLLILSEQRFLSTKLGKHYRRRDREHPAALDAGTPPRWVPALLTEVFPITFAVCFALFAWRYNAHILMKCLLVCYGLSLVMRALLPRSVPANANTDLA